MVVEWALAGAVILVGLLFSLRLMRKGMSTYDQKKAIYWQRIKIDEQRVAEDTKNMPLCEHLQVLRAAAEELIRLADQPANYSLASRGCVVTLMTPQGPWEMELKMRELAVQHGQRILHGRRHWVLRGGGQEEAFDELGLMMCTLNRYMRGEMGLPQEPPHLARRIR